MHKYLITSAESYGGDLDIFCDRLYERVAKHMPSYALYRDKSNTDYELMAVGFVEVCSRFEGLKSFIHQDAELAKKLGASGVHLTSDQFDEIGHAKSLGLEVIISTHTHEEVLRAQMLGADAVTYSPIFVSPGKGEPKGIDDLKKLLNECSINVFALGGIIDDSHVEMLELTKVYGFASIRYFI